jgi:aminomethyltransferase
MTGPNVELRTSPLHARHLAAGARMVPYAGWAMPLEYGGISEEHLAVRTRAGLFDVSHMGEIEVAGPGALAAVQRVAANDAGRLEPGQAQYSALLTEGGTFVDDVVVYRLASSHFLLVVNAANTAKDYAWISGRVAGLAGVAVVDTSSRYALVAVQGPAAREVLQPLTAADLSRLGTFRFTHGEVAGARATISRTGYTGEDGFEIFVPPPMADRAWTALLDSGAATGVVPCGLGARDTLRLEAALRLYGNDIDETTTPIEAALEWIVAWHKEFVGRERLEEQKRRGVSRMLAGFEMIDPGIARHGHAVLDGGREVGVVTSGTRTPFLEKAIGLAYVPVDLARPDTELTIDIRGRRARARVVALPFYSRRGRAGSPRSQDALSA